MSRTTYVVVAQIKDWANIIQFMILVASGGNW